MLAVLPSLVFIVMVYVSGAPTFQLTLSPVPMVIVVPVVSFLAVQVVVVPLEPIT
jgi:hypothetical protein